jgi:hypothetical protein
MIRAGLIAAALGIAVAACAQHNLVLNPGLEADADADGVPDHWYAPDPADYPANWRVGGEGSQVALSDIAHTGEHSIVYERAQITPPTVSNPWSFDDWEAQTEATSGHWSVALRTEDFPVDEYHLYRVRCWVRAQDILRLHIKFIATYVYPGREDEPVERWIQPTLNDPSEKTRVTGSWDWQMWEALVPVPEFVEQGRIEFWVREWSAPAKLWCDDMSVVEIRPYPYFERRRDR